MSKHTPGQWYARGDRQPMIASESDGRTIAIVYDHCADAQRDANARLIAAAPDMREWIVGALEGRGDYMVNGVSASALLARIDGDPA